ncbi:MULTISPECIES: tRNA epoxyqueuosine(34) reductase QueG [unclassified Lentimicrobium]|uniref:tRNA epoxyqueuosine(34) reductase QueG n=1 Tax=unclassified Lentimicrobium TaxID=2677434 RepID=UPI001551ED59|nr:MULTISPECIES: tRNA epoxyqueuosine(34) reductase QueG [unclassified Lentimicrobium]NPD45230.1 tRNA epoxyqueuosine(34) reductase QueG [Lentimicrobium sp. S6]NPD85409.1 tRNA epoxyqueuosine(34) reductase QueG [Lentimicrobium sp. L6]
MNSSSLSDFLANECLKEGFLDYSISKPETLEKEKANYIQWLEQNYHGKMSYLANHIDMKFNPELLMPGLKSIITVILNYFPQEKMAISDNYRLAKYAYGKDYHDIIKNKLNRIAENAVSQFGSMNYRAFTDSAPIPDRIWAQKGGLGWIGKNTLLINKEHGSFFFIGHLFIDRELEPINKTHEDLCLECNKCLKACPTQALFEPYKMDATKCLSYQTIENKSASKDIPPQQFRNTIYGCDICQDVCPFNKNPEPHQTESFNPHPDLLKLRKKDWQNLKAMHFGEIFRGSAVKRAGYKGMMQNIDWLQKLSE